VDANPTRNLGLEVTILRLVSIALDSNLSAMRKSQLRLGQDKRRHQFAFERVLQLRLGQVYPHLAQFRLRPTSISQQVMDLSESGRNSSKVSIGGINSIESWWVERQEALEQAGYMLRPRYRPGWKPSWEGTNKLSFRCEDGQSVTVRKIFSALLIRY
jgi:hypothetical protein